MTQIFSSDDTEFIRRFPAAVITHGFSQRRPVRSFQIPPEVVKSPTDFTDIHRFFLGRFFVTQISQMTQIFFIIGRHGISRRRPVRSLQIPPGIGQSDSPEIQKNLCKSVKSVGQNNPTKKNLCKSVKSVGPNTSTMKNLRHLRNLRDQKQ